MRNEKYDETGWLEWHAILYKDTPNYSVPAIFRPVCPLSARAQRDSGQTDAESGRHTLIGASLGQYYSAARTFSG